MQHAGSRAQREQIESIQLTKIHYALSEPWRGVPCPEKSAFRNLNMDANMNAKPSTLEQLKFRNAAAHARFLAAVVARTETELSEPHLPAGRSVKDVLGHLAWWDHWLVYTLFPDSAEIVTNPPPFIQELGNGDIALDELNAHVFSYNESRSLAEIRADFAKAYRAAAQVAALLTGSDVFDPAGRSALIGQPVAPLVFGIYEHYEEHAHEIEVAFA
jgi:hypothetical protein